MQPQTTTERELPMLAGIGAFVTWCEDLLAILSGPILTAGLAIALVALLTDGQLLVQVPALLWVWAISQAIGLDAQFIGAAAKLARAIRARRVWPILGYLALCGALGYVGYLASNVFATTEANGITTAEALSRLGMDSTSWIVQRSLLAVILVFLSGFLRYVAPVADVALSAQEERERLEADLLLEPLRQQKRAMQARGLRGVAAALRGKEPVEIPTPVQPRFTQTEPQATAENGHSEMIPPVQFTPLELLPKAFQKPPRLAPDKPRPSRGVRTPGKKSKRSTPNVVRLNVSAEDRARAAWQPGMSVAALETAADISRPTAQKYHAQFSAEGQQKQAAQ